MTKDQLIQELNIHFDKLSYLLHHQDDIDFDKVYIKDKWTTAQHIKHLILSMSPVNLAMRVPKFVLKSKFGVCNRPERSFEELVNKYETKLENPLAKAPKRFSPDPISSNQKEKLIKQIQHEKDKMIKNIQKWSEEQLSRYVLPHPLLGKLSFREMVYFSILHMDHHRMIIKEIYMKAD